MVVEQQCFKKYGQEDGAERNALPPQEVTGMDFRLIPGSKTQVE